MRIGLLFWILMLVWLVFGIWSFWPAGNGGPVLYGPLGGGVMLLLLVGLLGWKVFGPPVQS